MLAPGTSRVLASTSAATLRMSFPLFELALEVKTGRPGRTHRPANRLRRAPRSPPFTLDSLARAAGLVERIELGHVRLRKREVEDARVLVEAIAVRRLRQDDELALHAPAKQHLRRRPPDAGRHALYICVRQVAAGAERAGRLDGDAVFFSGLEEPPAMLERAERNLVDHRLHRGDLEHLLQLADVEVRNPDRSCIAQLARPFHAGPGPRRTALGPVDDVEVDVVEA